jgi:hypothetical protein
MAEEARHVNCCNTLYHHHNHNIKQPVGLGQAQQNPPQLSASLMAVFCIVLNICVSEFLLFV